MSGDDHGTTPTPHHWSRVNHDRGMGGMGRIGRWHVMPRAEFGSSVTGLCGTTVYSAKWNGVETVPLDQRPTEGICPKCERVSR